MNTAAIITPLKIEMAGLTAGFSRAKAEARSFSASMGSAMASVRKVFASPIAIGLGAIGGLAAAKKAIDEVAQSMERIDQGAKLVDRLGISAEAFNALRHQANLAGADLGTFTMAMQQQQKALADAVAGAKNSPFEKLGLDAKKLIELPTEKSLGAIADAIKEIENPTERAAAVMEIFGTRAGPELQAMLMEGSAGIEAAQKSMEAMGGAMSRLDMAQVEAANDAITDLKESVSIAFDRIAVSLAPAIQQFAHWAKEASVAVADWASQNLHLIFTADSLGESIFHLTRAGGMFGKPITDMGVAMKALGEAKLAADVASAELSGAKDLDDRIDAQRMLTAALKDQFRLAKQIKELEGVPLRTTSWDSVKSLWTKNPQPGPLVSNPSGLSDNFIGRIKEQLSEANKSLEAFHRQKFDAIKLPDIEGPKLNMPAITSEFENMKDRATSMMEDLQNDLKKFERAGMTPKERRMAEFAETQPVGAKPGGLFGDDLAEFKKTLDGLDFKEQSKAANDMITQWAEGMRTPMEELHEKLENLHKWKDEGLINGDAFSAGIEAAKREMEGLREKKDEAIDMTPKIASFIRSGSQDAYKLQAEIAAQQQGRADATGGKSATAMTAKQEETNKLLARIEKALADRPVIELSTREF